MNNKVQLLLLFWLMVISVKAQKKWSLDDCITYAKEHNIDVVKQKIRNEILEKDIKIAKGNFYPDANFNASQNFFLGNFLNLSTGVNQSKSSYSNFNLATSWNLFNGLSDKYSLEKSKESFHKGNADLENIRFDLSMNITVKYLAVLYNKDILKVAKEQVEISNENFKRLKQLYAKGLKTKREMLEIESTLASDKKEVSVALNNVENSLIDLKELLDVNNIDNFDVMPLDSIGVTYNESGIDKISERIILNNPQIKSYDFYLKMKELDIQIYKSRFYPRINANYSYNTSYYRLLGDSDFLLDDNNSFSSQIKNNLVHYIGLSAVIPIFNRFSTKENYKKSIDELKISRLELENKKNLLRNRIEVAQNDVETAIASLNAAEIAYDTQQKAFSIIRINYQNGNISSYEFLDSKSKLIRTTSSYIKAKFDLFFKQRVLEYYLDV